MKLCFLNKLFAAYTDILIKNDYKQGKPVR